MSLKPDDIIKALGIIGELAAGIAQITEVVKGGMSASELELLISKQNEEQERLKELLRQD